VVEEDGIRDHTDIDITNQLWEGMDVLDRQTEVDAMRSKGTYADKSTVLPKLQMLGMFDSGTNLLGALLKMNLGSHVLNQMCPGSNEEGYHCHFWKHTPPQDVNWNGMRIVALVRSPLAQISGWCKAPYDLEPCISNSGLDWLSDPSYTCSIDWLSDQSYTCSIHNRQFDGPSGVWNAYSRGYHNLAAEGATIKIVEYENVVLNTEKVVRDIGTFLGVPVKDFEQVSVPAKSHGNPVGRELAVRKIRERTYMEYFPWSYVSNVKQVCHNIEKGMMESHSFQLNNSEERLYNSDCD
jgi:hypothetical protein